MKYSYIRSVSPIGNFRSRCIADLICMLISPYFSMIFIKKRIKPNMITMFMIFSGIIGAFVFSLPYSISKVIGICMFYLWYTMDCSDGEVARITQCFSKYGKELDYMAHLICHPLMTFSLLLSYLQLDKYNDILLCLSFFIFISLELVIRNYISFDTYIDAGRANRIPQQKKLLKYIIVQFCIYPNFILIFPVFFMFDWFFGFNSLVFFFVFLFFFFFLGITGTFRKLKTFYYS